MEHEYGTVLRSSHDRVTLQMEASEQCTTCSAKDACVTLGEETVRQLELPTTKKLCKGDRVTVGYEPGSRIASAFIVFILPILFLIIGYFTGMQIFGTEGKSILTAFVVFILSFAIVRLFGRILEKRKSFQPVIVHVQPASDQ